MKDYTYWNSFLFSFITILSMKRVSHPALYVAVLAVSDNVVLTAKLILVWLMVLLSYERLSILLFFSFQFHHNFAHESGVPLRTVRS